MSCPHTATCPLFPLFRLKATQRTWRIRYCEGNHQQCARFERFSKGDPVPRNLLPNGQLIRIDSSAPPSE